MATLTDAYTGWPRRIVRQLSTLTWRLRDPVLAELRVQLAAEVAALHLGTDEKSFSGVLGLLER